MHMPGTGAELDTTEACLFWSFIDWERWVGQKLGITCLTDMYMPGPAFRVRVSRCWDCWVMRMLHIEIIIKNKLILMGMPGPEQGPEHACSRIHQIQIMPGVPDTHNAHAGYWCRTWYDRSMPFLKFEIREGQKLWIPCLPDTEYGDAGFLHQMSKFHEICRSSFNS